MDHLIQQVKVAYFLGNYGRVLEIWQSTDESTTSDLEYYYFLISRALIASRELKPKTLNLHKEPSKKLLEITEIVNKWIGPLLKPQRPNTSLDDDRKLIEEVLKKAKENIPNSNQRIYQMICAYLSVNSCEAYYALSLDFNDAFKQELLFLQLTIYLRAKRFDLAESSLQAIKQIDDEDILAYLGQVYSHIHSNQHEQAIQAIQQTKQRYGESAKLMNLLLTVYISQNKFEEAYEFANKLQQALIEKEQFSDRNELEICISNLIVLCDITGRTDQKDASIKMLQSINPASTFLKRLNDRIHKLDKL